MNAGQPITSAALLLPLKYPGLSDIDRARIAERAAELVAIHGGNVRRAHDTASELAYGNVSLAARASMAPVADFIGWMANEMRR